MANISPSDILVVQRPAGQDAGTYKTPFSDITEATRLWKEEAGDGGRIKLEPVNPDGYIDGGTY